MPTDGPRHHRAAVLGQPVLHSLSPALHTAGYAAAGLTGWAYTAVECGEEELAGFVAGLGPEWAGLSLTMPLKEVALAVADVVDPLAAALGAANTLVRGEHGWTGYNTDAPGIADVLRAAGVSAPERVAVLGGGGTARAALGAAHEMGASVTAFVRRPEAGDELRPVAHALGLDYTTEGWGRVPDAAGYDVVISTVPKGASDALATVAWKPATVVFDVVYDPWPTALAEGALRAGCAVISGLDLLHAQGVRQFELFTGGPAPVEAMRHALLEAAGAR